MTMIYRLCIMSIDKQYVKFNALDYFLFDLVEYLFRFKMNLHECMVVPLIFFNLKNTPNETTF